ncbi:uncharacterized protein LOC134252364 [Saccostrea cucullata]|uniref:uncharacterized protein LOC134252364 n=1 Tax=Saccostrea cuccullata TaxID=36930 RepID=UPI002ED6AF25
MEWITSIDLLVFIVIFKPKHNFNHHNELTAKTTTTTSSKQKTAQKSTSTKKPTTSTTSPSPEICNLDTLVSKLASLHAVPVGTPETQDFKLGEKLHFKCAKDYRFINGSLEQGCGSDASWEKEMPYCKRCKCPCERTKNQVIIRTQKQLQDKIAAIQKKLVVEKKNLDSQKNAKISVADPRPSAKAVGSIVGV